MLATTAHAQLGRARVYGASPQYWVGLSYGYVDGTTINDGDTGATWRFGYTSQIRATLEKSIQRGVAIGVSAAFSSPPLTYSTSAFDPQCGTSCSATADVTQYMLFLHGGSGIGFHGLYNLEGGLTEFANFRAKDTNAQLAPAKAQYDFTFGFGGGLGYGFSPTTDVYVGEMFDLILHPQGGNTSSSAPRLTTFRLGARIGF